MDALAKTLDTERRAFLSQLDNIGKRPKPKRVHALRTSARRLLAALELSTRLGVGPKSATVKHLKKVLDLLSPLRDAQVQLRTLESLPPNAVEPLTKAVARKKRHFARRVGKRLASFDAATFEHEVSRVTSALQAESSAAPLASIVVQGALAEQHLGVERQRRGATGADPKALHQLRLSLKRYRYALDALAETLPASAQQLGKLIKQLQDELGAAHDAHVLAETAQEYAQAAPESEPLRELSQQLLRRSQLAQESAAQSARNAPLAWPF